MPQTAGGSDGKRETETTGVVDEADIQSETDDRHTVDRLLASTEHGWDVDAQVLTLQQAVAETRTERSEDVPDVSKDASVSDSKGPSRASKGPPPLPRRPASIPRLGLTPSPSSVSPAGDMTEIEGLIDLLRARVVAMEGGSDKIGLARARLELSVAHDALLGEQDQAVELARAALKVDPNAMGARALLRRAIHGRAALAETIEHVDSELPAVTAEAHRVELLALRARLLAAQGGRSAEVRAAWEATIAISPNHPAALKGLEVELLTRAQTDGAPRDWDALATHLGKMADAFTADARLAAWLHVERAFVLDRRLNRADAARSALERALLLDPRVGPVRSTLVRHVASQGDWTALSRLLAEEATIETDDARATRCDLDAAMIATWRLGEPSRAVELLERAASRAPTDPIVDRLVVDELVRLHETSGRWSDAARARRTRLASIVDPAVRAYELRALAIAADSEGDVDAAIADLQGAIALDATGASDAEWLDRLLAKAGRTDQRIAFWLHEGARSAAPAQRARAFLRAAVICEEAARFEDALRHMRSAWVADPGNEDALEGLTRLLGPRVSDDAPDGPRSLIELYTSVADQTRDPGRRIAYLEKVALLWEDLLGDPARASRAYEQILGIDGQRRSALIGLQRTAGRAGDKALLARALLEEARTATDRPSQLALCVRAATALSTRDAPRALQLVRDVLQRDATHLAARTLETRLHEDAGRWELAAKSMRARIEATAATAEKISMWIALAQLQQTRLHDPVAALASLEQASSLDPAHPVLREEIARVLDSHSDVKLLRETVDRLATAATTAEERVRQLARAAEIDELRLGDDASAVRTMLRALAEMPENELFFERLARLTARRARQRHGTERAEFAAFLGRRIDRASASDAERALDWSFELARLLVETGQEPRRAMDLFESVLETVPDHVPALRSLEGLRRQATSEPEALGSVLARQAVAFVDPAARLGALCNLVFLEEWEQPAGDPSETYGRILELDPSDPSALEAVLRRTLADARRGDPEARASATAALRSLAAFSSNESARRELEIRLSLLLEATATSGADEGAESLWREAMERYQSVLNSDPLSLIAATGLYRIAARSGDASGMLAACTSLAELAPDPRVRARYLLEASDVLLASPDTAIGGERAQRRERAVAMLEKALEADPNSVPVGGRLATVLLEEGQGERLVTAFQSALGRAKSADAVVMFGSELARVARDDLHDLPVGIEAMRKVRAAVPQHVPSLLTLAELCIAQRVWPEAVDALEAVVSVGRENAPKLTALFALASIYEKVLDRSADVDRVLRTALAIDPSNARALQALVRRATATPINGDDADAQRHRRETADLLERLAAVESDPEQKSVLLVELAEARQRLLDPAGAEKALIEATACAPSNVRAFTRLAALFRTPSGVDAVAYARALTALIELGEKLGHLDARWFASLGHAEVESLSRPQEGIVHLQRAVDLDPTLFEARYSLATACASVTETRRTAEVLLAMISPSPRPLLSILDLPGALSLLETSLATERRMDESIVTRELRAFAGELDDASRDWLRLRRLSPNGHGALDRTGLVTHVLPASGRHALLEVAAAVAGIEAKVVRSDLTDLGLSPRDRIHPRSGHPMRTLVDRLARKLGVSDVELAMGPKVTRTRVLAMEEPWIVVPAALAERDEPAQMLALSRALARIAFGVPWLDELPPEKIEALLIAAARQAVPGYAPGDSKLVAQYEVTIPRALTRRQRRLLEELAPHIASPQGAPPLIGALMEALLQAEIRTAFLLTGDLLAVADNLAQSDEAVREAVASPGSQALAILLEHPIMGDVARFALTPEATALRHRVGTSWAR